MIPSFGGYTADTTGTDIADSCTSVPAIAQVFESLITTYHVPRIDLDVEADSLTNAAGINRRNEAIAMTEAWAAAHHQRIQFSYTLPTFPAGLTAPGLAVLQNAVADGARISTVNLLTFDYYFGTQQDMVADTETAAAGLYRQLQSLYPAASARQLWHMIGVTEMPGIDDYGPDETFSTADAVTVLHWAQRQGIGLVSFWALQRDNGGCPGTKGAGTCSGVDPAGVVLQPRVRALHQLRQVQRSRGAPAGAGAPGARVACADQIRSPRLADTLGCGGRPAGMPDAPAPALWRPVARLPRVGDGVGAGSGVGVSGRAGLGAGVWTAG